MLATLGHPYDVRRASIRARGAITTSSPPIVVNGVIIVGNSAHQGGGYSRIENVPGDVQAFDARTGRHLWTFHTIPRAGEFGNETWENDAWRYVGNVNVWAPLTADPELNLVYLATDAPTNDYFGGHRPGANLFGSSLVAVDVRTGERRWHFQTIHHDIWDWDLPVAPILVDLTVDGRQIPAVVQASKQAFIYAFNRETGEPIWPIEERPVPPGRRPRRVVRPTQPFPTRPAAYELQGLSEDDLDRLHARAPRDGDRAGVVTSSSVPIFTPYVHADNRSMVRAGAVPERHWRHEHPGRSRARSRDRHPVRAVAKGMLRRPSSARLGSRDDGSPRATSRGAPWSTSSPAGAAASRRSRAVCRSSSPRTGASRRST
jgi:hypothetical protein